MTPSTVLVIGAGASVAMGYPSGEQLRAEIIESTAAKYAPKIIASNRSIEPHYLVEFTEAFRNSQMNSIDAFLARRPEYSDVGKRAIAAVLLDCEKAETLHSCSHSDKWYQYLFNQFSEPIWENLSFADRAIVSFNYDRSLEHYLIRAMAASYNRTEAECFRKLGDLITHVYGDLGSCDPTASDYFAYGYGAQSLPIQVASSRIRVIPEGRTEDETISKARRILSESDRIVFLGFGFDKTNLERLDSRNTCAKVVQWGDQQKFRSIVATCYGLTDEESLRALTLTAGGVAGRHPDLAGFVQADCLTMLRRTLILASDNY
jgi:hypothetical protein